MEQLTLEGNRYLGRFQAEQKDRNYMFSGDTGERHEYWWQGQVFVRDQKTGEEGRFLFNTERTGRFVSTLPEAIISFSSSMLVTPIGHGF